MYIYENFEENIPANLPEGDKELIRATRDQDWTEIREDDAETEEGRKILHRIAVTGYHYDEARAGMI